MCCWALPGEGVLAYSEHVEDKSAPSSVVHKTSLAIFSLRIVVLRRFALLHSDVVGISDVLAISYRELSGRREALVASDYLMSPTVLTCPCTGKSRCVFDCCFQLLRSISECFKLVRFTPKHQLESVVRLLNAAR